jgi:hypothetical protein
MIHKDFECLRSDWRDLAIVTFRAMQTDAQIKAAGYFIIPLETLRDLAVQMAYVVRSRIKARPEDPHDDLGWVQDFFRKAGLSWIPSAAENASPSTWTLDSAHIKGLAFDAAPSKDGINPDWSAPDWVWERMATRAEAYGIVPGRHFPDRKKDSPHFEAAK